MNRLKIDKYLNIKKEEENIKFLSQSLSKSKFTFVKLAIVLGVFFMVLFILDITFLKQEFQAYQIILVLGFAFCLVATLFFVFKDDIYMDSFKIMSAVMLILTSLIVAYIFNADIEYGFLLICFFSVAVTQTINMNFFILLLLMFALAVVGIIVDLILDESVLNKIVEPILQIICILFNLHIYYQIELSSRISFVKSETF